MSYEQMRSRATRPDLWPVFVPPPALVWAVWDEE